MTRHRSTNPRDGQAVSLPVLEPGRRRTAPGTTRMGRRRAVVLILVHLAIVTHLLHWLIGGETMAPAVLSESMRTLEYGQVNPGTILFLIAILVTLICGRFLCGWACHMAALQDLCAWMLKKVGIRPHLFRARLLGFVPLGLALYMFAWPSFNRIVLVPVMQDRWPETLAWIGAAPPITGLSTKMTTENLWDGLPGVWLAIPFLLICGFATVYFLGARGLCRYGCPYGGVFAPIEKLAPGRIVVNLDNCDQCGICTAVCGSGIRVHEEVNAYGRVISNTCMKTLDCVSACPTSALSLSFTRPAITRGQPIGPPPKPRYDLSWPQELGIIAVFLAVLLTVRGLYGTFPLLMSASIAACTAFVAWKLGKLATSRNLRFGGFQLRHGGRLRPAGFAFAGLGLILTLLFIQSAFIRSVHWYAGRLDGEVTLSREEVFTPRRAPLPEPTRAAAERALALYTLTSSWSDGGWALANTHEADIRAGWLALVLGDLPQAEALILRALDRGGRSDGLSADVARIMLLQGDTGRAIAYLDELVDRWPAMLQSLDLLCRLHAGAGNFDRVESILRQEVERSRTPSVLVRAHLAQLLYMSGRQPEAIAQLERAAADAPADLRILGELAFALAGVGRPDEGLQRLEAAAAMSPQIADQCRQWASEIRVAFPGRTSIR